MRIVDEFRPVSEEAESDLAKASPVYLSANVNPPSPSKAESGPLKMSDRAQAQFVKLVGGDPETILREIAKPLPAPESGSVDRTTVSTEVVLTHLKSEHFEVGIDKTASPADRFQSLEFVLRPRTKEDFELVSWNRLESVYGNLDLGEVSRGSERSFNAKLAPSLSGAISGDVEAGYSGKESRAEKVELSQRILQVSGWLTEAEGRIILQGGPRLGLEGNTSVKLTIRLPGRTVVMTRLELFDDDGVPKAPGDVRVRHVPYRLPYSDGRRGVDLFFGAQYEYRHVECNAETYVESDDDVALYRGWAPRLADGGEVVPSLTDRHAYDEWRYLRIPLMGKDALEARSRSYPLMMDRQPIWLVRGRGQALELRRVVFASEAEAADFRRWLLMSASSDGPLGLGPEGARWRVALTRTVPLGAAEAAELDLGRLQVGSAPTRPPSGAGDGSDSGAEYDATLGTEE